MKFIGYIYTKPLPLLLSPMPVFKSTKSIVASFCLCVCCHDRKETLPAAGIFSPECAAISFGDKEDSDVGEQRERKGKDTEREKKRDSLKHMRRGWRKVVFFSHQFDEESALLCQVEEQRKNY